MRRDDQMSLDRPWIKQSHGVDATTAGLPRIVGAASPLPQPAPRSTLLASASTSSR